MVSINAFVDRDIIAHWSPSVLSNTENPICSTQCHIVIKGFSDGWLRFKICDHDEMLPSIAQGSDGYEICLPISYFIRFDRIA